MTAPSPREVVVCVLAALGLLGLAALGGWVQAAAGVAICLVGLSPWLRPTLPPAPWALLVVPVVIGLGAWVVLGGADPTVAVGIGLAWMVLPPRLARAAPRDDHVVALVATLMLVLAAVRSTSPGLLAVVAGWAVTLPATLLLVAVDPAGRTRWGGVRALPVVVAALAVATFVALPRLREADLGDDAPVDTRVGFSDTVSLGDLGTLLRGDAVVFRAWVQGLDGDAGVSLYFRGRRLDRFDGRRWRSSAGPGRRRSVAGIEGVPERTVRIEVQREPGRGTGPAPLFVVGHVLAVAADPPGAREDSLGDWQLVDGSERGTYTVVALPGSAPGVPVDRLDDAEVAALTALPADLDPRVAALAAEVVGDQGDARVQAEALRAALLRDHTYTRAPGDRDVSAPLSAFLFDTREGHCEYFASALAVMLRTRGVPARLVTGFAGGDWLPATKQWVFREEHAHAWVEAWDSGRGWFVVDATPGPLTEAVSLASAEGIEEALSGVWYRRVLDYDLDVQVDGLRRLGARAQGVVLGGDGPRWVGIGMVVAGLALVVALLAALWRAGARRLAGEVAPTEPLGPVGRVHARARRRVARRGWQIPDSLPPVEAGQWLAERAGEPGAALVALAWLHYRVRYGGEDARQVLGEARALARRVQALPRQQAPSG